MQDVNEAWRVLGDRDRRRAYDLSLAPGPVLAPLSVDPDDVPVPRSPLEPDDVAARVVRGLPWVVVAVVLLVIFVFTAFAGGSDRADSAWDLAGKCISTSGGGGVREVACEPGGSVVSLVVSRQSQCPRGASSVPYRDEWLCVRAVTE
jgi:hypothetical protein